MPASDVTGPPKGTPGGRGKARSSPTMTEEKKSSTREGQSPQVPDAAPDVFESSTADDPVEPPRASVELDDLPIELIGLTDSFIDSLSAKVHPSPLPVDALARRFQEFYELAASHIQTHTDALATRQRREEGHSPSAPAASATTGSTRASPASLLRASKAASLGTKDRPKLPTAASAPRRASEQQMLTAEELAGRKRARKALEQKRVLLEEAVERRLCEGIYDRIYRPRSAQDEAQDDKLRSKTAALAVVGIGPADLGVELDEQEAAAAAAAVVVAPAAERQEEVRRRLEPARRELVLMHQSRYPLGKLNRLKAAHKGIIDTLAHFHPSSSADELMPMLIYTLITLPPEDLNVVSDLHFIQRFRWAPKLVGEAAYCLTNLEAAISFLDTVDLSTLRADEAPSGPAKTGGGSGSGTSSTPGTPKTETFPPAYTPIPSAATPSAPETTASTVSAAKLQQQQPPPPPNNNNNNTTSGSLRVAVQLRNRRLSDLVNTPAQALGAASDAVFSTADQGLKTIGASLGDSYKFLLGKLRDGQVAAAAVATTPGSGGGSGGLVVPRTLDDARKLIGTPPPDDESSDDRGGLEEAAAAALRAAGGAARDDKVLHLIGGSSRKAASGVSLRDRSVDSAGSGTSSSGSARKGFLSAADEKDKATTLSAGAANPALIDSVRNLGNSLNPMARLTGMGFRGFGRTASTPTAPTTRDAVAGAKAPGEGVDLATAFPDIAAALPPKEPVKISGPIRRFMELDNPADLKIGEVLELLRDYRRLARALKERDAFRDY